MHGPTTPLVSKLILFALVVIGVCLVVLVAQKRSPSDSSQGPVARQQPSQPAVPFEQWQAEEPARLKLSTTPPQSSTPRVGSSQKLPPAATTRQEASHSASDDTLLVSRDSHGSGGTIETPGVALEGPMAYPAGMPLSGRVILSGQPPPETPIHLDPTCGPLHKTPLTTRHYVMDEQGGLANVWVYVENAPPSHASPTQHLVLDQIACEYQPYVFAMVSGQPLLIQNSDPFLHNVNTVASSVPPHRFNIAQPNRGKQDIKIFSKPELPLKFMCNVHSWMFAYAGVFDHGYFAVSDAAGRFQIPAGLPPGRYVLAARHLKAGETRHELQIAADAAAFPLELVLRVPR